MRLIDQKNIIALLALVFIVCASLVIPPGKDNASLDEDIRLFKLLESLGYDTPDHFPNTELFGVSVARGEALVKDGFSTRPGGGTTRKQSKHFVCTSCHNLEREDPDLANPDPQRRLEYTLDKGIPFLQGTSLYGAVNRESFYNGDYYKKYGELVIPARNNIREAINLCAVECAQGRELADWELESILAYLWTIDLKLADLELNDSEKLIVDKAMKDRTLQDSALTIIQKHYRTDSPAHFGTAYESRLAVDSLVGNADNGQLIYENSCLHCHANRRYSYFLLDDASLTFKHLAKKAGGYTDHSVFQVARYGVFSKSGKHSYMPQYPMEKMSDQQLADLYAYIQMRADQ